MKIADAPVGRELGICLIYVKLVSTDPDCSVQSNGYRGSSPSVMLYLHATLRLHGGTLRYGTLTVKYLVIFNTNSSARRLFVEQMKFKF